MRAAVWEGPDQIVTRSVPVPTLSPGWALVKVAYNGICGTDLGIVHGNHPRAQAPLVLGHEMSGTVADPGTTGLAEGTPVVAEPLMSCGRCRACRTGSTHVCRSLTMYGIDQPGAMAQYVALPASVLHPVPAAVSLRMAALCEPLAVAVHSVRTSGMLTGDVVAIYGAGPIGVLTALVARHLGAGRVVVTEPSAWRRQVAAGFGLDVVEPPATMPSVLASMTDGEGADTTFDTAAHPSVAAELSAATRVLGRIVLVGVYKRPEAMDLRSINFKEQTVQGVRVYRHDDVTTAIQLIASDALGLSELPTAVFSLDDVAGAFAAASDGLTTLKVLLAPAATEVAS